MERIVSYKVYKVLESMVKDGLITGLPYSEFTTEEPRLELDEDPDQGAKG